MDRATFQMGRTTSRNFCMATKCAIKKNKTGCPGFNSELCGMDEVCSKSSLIFWPPIPHMPHEV